MQLVADILLLCHQMKKKLIFRVFADRRPLSLMLSLHTGRSGCFCELCMGARRCCAHVVPSCKLTRYELYQAEQRLTFFLLERTTFTFTFLMLQ